MYDVAPTVETLVLKAQDVVTTWLNEHSELEKQAMYQALYARGHRIPVDLHHKLRELARRELGK